MVTIRTEVPDDYSQVFELNYRAFGNRDLESRLVEKIRKSPAFIPELSIVAERDGKIVGHLLLSKARLIQGDREQDVIVLAPLAVLPEYQRQGIGSRLMNEGLKRVGDLGYGFVFLIGHPSYYPKFGFKPARACGFELTQFSVSDEVFMVYERNEERIEEKLSGFRGELRYPDAFF